MVMMTWLADALRRGGLQVEEVDGWKTRGLGEMSEVRGILVHHTGGPRVGDRPSMNLVLNGRPDLRGPLSQLFLTRAGVWVVLAAGRCNHAGAGKWQGVATGNSSFIGVEAENAGTTADPWPVNQVEAYERGCAAILTHLGVDDVWVAGHREYALPKGRKIDPLFDMDDFRENVRAHMQGASAPLTVSPVLAKRLMLQKGDSNADVVQLQLMLGFAKEAADGDFGPITDKAVRLFQERHALTVDGKVGPATWKALGVS